jgi:hypothetical protein
MVEYSMSIDTIGQESTGAPVDVDSLLGRFEENVIRFLELEQRYYNNEKMIGVALVDALKSLETKVYEFTEQTPNYYQFQNFFGEIDERYKKRLERLEYIKGMRINLSSLNRVIVDGMASSGLVDIASERMTQEALGLANHRFVWTHERGLLEESKEYRALEGLWFYHTATENTPMADRVLERLFDRFTVEDMFIHPDIERSYNKFLALANIHSHLKEKIGVYSWA